MNKSICIFFLMIFLSCDKEVKTFTPTTKIESIHKNVELKDVLWNLRFEKPCLILEIEEDESFKNFLKKAGIKNLILLTECEIPLVRCFAFKALVEKRYPKIREVLLRHVNDNEMVILKNYDVELNLPVKSYMLEQLSPFSRAHNRYDEVEFAKMKNSFDI